MTVRSFGCLEQSRRFLLSNTDIPDAIYRLPRSSIKHFQARRHSSISSEPNHNTVATKNHIVLHMTSSRASNYPRCVMRSGQILCIMAICARSGDKAHLKHDGASELEGQTMAVCCGINHPRRHVLQRAFRSDQSRQHVFLFSF